MEYINPLAALQITPKDLKEGHPIDLLKREKKKLLAEFELHDTPVIQLRGRELDKSAVIRLFEQLEDDSLLDFHLTIFQSPSLMAFLEEASLEFFYSGDISKLPANPPEFLAYIGPFFASKYNTRLFHAFRQRDWEEIDVMCAHPLAIPMAYHAACYKDTYRHLHGKIQEIELQSEKIAKGTVPDGKVQEMCDEMLVSTLNQLPEYFGGTRDKYSVALEGLAIAVHNAHQRAQLGIFILRQGLKLNTSKEVQDRLQYVLDQLVALAPGEAFFEQFTGSDGESKITPWLVAAGIGAVILVVAKMILD